MSRPGGPSRSSPPTLRPSAAARPGTIGAIAIYDLDGKALAGFSGINASIADVLNALQTYISSHDASALDAIFYNNTSISYSGVARASSAATRSSRASATTPSTA